MVCSPRADTGSALREVSWCGLLSLGFRGTKVPINNGRVALGEIYMLPESVSFVKEDNNAHLLKRYYYIYMLHNNVYHT